MKKEVLILIGILLCLNIVAQTISVASFKLLETDLTANTVGSMEQDQNGEVAALIKVVTTQTGFTFDGGALGIVKTKQTPGEIWVYLPHGAKKITIKHPQYGILRDYYYPISIEAARTYEMIVKLGFEWQNIQLSRIMEIPILQSRIDSVSYAIGMAQSQGLLPYLRDSIGIDLNYLDDFTLGLIGEPEAGTDQMLKGINKELFGEKSSKSISKELFYLGFISGYTNKNGIMTINQSVAISQELMIKVKREELLITYGENKRIGELYLAKNVKNKKVHVLQSGVQYKILKQGYGPIPKETSIVKVHYEGRLLDNKIFDSTYERNQPAVFHANGVIKGLTDALTHMPQGSIWEVYIPEELAYGEREQGPDIKPFSILIFKVELLNVSN